MTKQKILQKSADYKSLLIDIRSIIDRGLCRAYKAVDNIRVQTYWQLGERIMREEFKYQNRAEYGKRLIEYLANDLEWSRRLLFEIIEFYKMYPIVHALRAQFSWTHYGVFIRIKNKAKREFYELQTLKNSWSYRELERRIKQKEYERARKTDCLDITIAKKIPTPEEIFKDIYNFDFLQLAEGHSEKDLETALTANIRKTLLELGNGFAFIGQQVKILIAGQHCWVDLVFFNVAIPCYVLVELKTEKFKHEHVGQMNMYLNYFREHEKRPWEREPIGLIICKEKDNEEVHYALGDLSEKNFVAEYKMKLPSEAEIKKRLKVFKLV